MSQIQDFGDLQDLQDLQGDVINTSIFTLLIYFAYLIPAFISTRNTISHHISARDATSPGFAYPYEKQFFSILAQGCISLGRYGISTRDAVSLEGEGERTQTRISSLRVRANKHTCISSLRVRASKHALASSH